MRKVFIPLLYAVSFCRLMLQAAYAQNYEQTPLYQISVYSVSCRFVGDNYRILPMVSWSYPPIHYKEWDGWIYEIALTIKLTGENFVWKAPIGVIFIFPDVSRQTEIINKEAMPLYSNYLYEFRFDVICRRKGWAMIQMSPLEEWDKLNTRDVDFRISQVCLE